MKKKVMFSWLVSTLLILGLFGITGFVSGQNDYSLDGHIYDQDNSQSIDGAVVTFQSKDSPSNNEMTTDYSGYYSTSLPEGNYILTITADGYETMRVDNFYISNDDTRDYNLRPTYSDGGDSWGDGDGGDGDGDDENGGNQSIDDYIPLGLQENGPLYLGICFLFIIVLFVSFIIIACASLGIFVRLGKIKKDIKQVTQNQAYQQPYQQPPRQQSRQRPQEPPEHYPEPLPDWDQRSRERQAPPPPPPARRVEPSREEKEQKLFCPHCGSGNKYTSKFCNKCGENL